MSDKIPSSNFNEISVKIPIDNTLNFIEGNLSIVSISNYSSSNRIVIFAHGSGSSRHSLRNKFVAGCIKK